MSKSKSCNHTILGIGSTTEEIIERLNSRSGSTPVNSQVLHKPLDESDDPKINEQKRNEEETDNDEEHVSSEGAESTWDRMLAVDLEHERKASVIGRSEKLSLSELESLTKRTFSELQRYSRLTGFARELKHHSLPYEIHYSNPFEDPDAHLIVLDDRQNDAAPVLELNFSKDRQEISAQVPGYFPYRPLGDLLFILGDDLLEETFKKDGERPYRNNSSLSWKDLFYLVSEEVNEFLSKRKGSLVDAVDETSEDPALARTISIASLDSSQTGHSSDLIRTDSPTIGFTVRTPPSPSKNLAAKKIVPKKDPGDSDEKLMIPFSSDNPDPFKTSELTDPSFQTDITKSGYPDSLMAEESLQAIFTWADRSGSPDKDSYVLGYSQQVGPFLVSLELNFLRYSYNTSSDGKFNYLAVNMVTQYQGGITTPFSFALESVLLGERLTKGLLLKKKLPLALDGQVKDSSYYDRGGVFSRSYSLLKEPVYVRTPLIVENARTSLKVSRQNKGRLIFTPLIAYGLKLKGLLKR